MIFFDQMDGLFRKGMSRGVSFNEKLQPAIYHVFDILLFRMVVVLHKTGSLLNYRQCWMV